MINEKPHHRLGSGFRIRRSIGYVIQEEACSRTGPSPATSALFPHSRLEPDRVAAPVPSC